MTIHRELVSYARGWPHGQVIKRERFQKQPFAQLAGAERSTAQQRLVVLLGPACESYLPLFLRLPPLRILGAAGWTHLERPPCVQIGLMTGIALSR